MVIIALGLKLEVFVEHKHVQINQELLKIMLHVKHFLNHVLQVEPVVSQ